MVSVEGMARHAYLSFDLPAPFFEGMIHIASASLPMRGEMKQGAEVASMLANRRA
jgi:hypothetical protein